MQNKTIQENEIVGSIQVTDLEGNAVDLMEKYKGQNLLLIIYNNDCLGCTGRAIPLAYAFQQQFDSIQAIGIHANFGTRTVSKSDIESIFTTKEVPFPIFIDPNHRVYDQFDSEGTPQWLLITKSGILFKSIFGSQDGAQMRLMRCLTFNCMKNYIILIPIFIFSQIACAQDSLVIKKKKIGTFHTTNTQFNGFSFGIASGLDKHRNVKTNGLRLEVPGFGIISWMSDGPVYTIDTFDLEGYKYSEIMNGLNISTGSWCDCNYNGLTIGLVGQYGKFGNGVSLAGLSNTIEKQNGVQISAFNGANEGKGLQIGLINRSKNFKGVQIGLWNVNHKRKTPFVNWSFK